MIRTREEDFAGHSAEHKSDRDFCSWKEEQRRGISGFLYTGVKGVKMLMMHF